MQKTSTSLSQGVYYEHLETINGVRFTPQERDITACLLSGKASKALSCSRSCWKDGENQSIFIDELATHLKRAGINRFLELKENNKPTYHPVHKVDSQSIKYVPSNCLINSLQTDCYVDTWEAERILMN